MKRKEKERRKMRVDWLGFYKLNILPWSHGEHMSFYKIIITIIIIIIIIMLSFKKCTLHTIIKDKGYIAQFLNSRGQCPKHIICWGCMVLFFP